MGLYGLGVRMCSHSINSKALLRLALLGAFVLLISDPGSEAGVLTSLLVYVCTLVSLDNFIFAFFLVALDVHSFSP